MADGCDMMHQAGEAEGVRLAKLVREIIAEQKSGQIVSLPLAPVPQEPSVTITYTDLRGRCGEREIIPRGVRFAGLGWGEAEWLLDAFDVGRQQEWSFPLAGVAWKKMEG